MINKVVGSNTTFGKLKECIVGNFYTPDYFDELPESPFKERIQRLTQESCEDMDKMVNVLKTFNITVQRLNNPFPKPCVVSNGTVSVINPRAAFTPRDNMEFIDNKCISYFTYEQPTRWWDDWAHHDLFMEYFNKGAEWHQMPKGPFDEEHYYNLVSSGSEITLPDDRLLPGNKNLYFSGANVIKFGKDIFYTLKYTGNEAGLQWAKSVIGGDYRWHLLPLSKFGNHVDASLKILRPGVMLSKYTKDEVVDAIPQVKNWDIIHVEHELNDPKTAFNDSTVFPGHYGFDADIWSNEWTKKWVEHERLKTIFDINILCIDEKTVMINIPNTEFERKLHALGFDTVNCNHRNRHFWGHGINCMTHDVLREDEAIDYFR